MSRPLESTVAGKKLNSLDEGKTGLRLLKWYSDIGVDELIGTIPIDRLELFSPSTEAPFPVKGPSQQILNETSDAVRSQGSSQTLKTEVLLRDRGLGLGERKYVQPTTVPLLATPPPEDVVQDAHKIASSCNSLEDVRDALNSFHGCPLRRTATNLVLYDGDPRADLMIIGEAPGRDEDVLGKPFVGRSGRLLDHMLSAIGLSRTSNENKNSVFISNCIFWRPPGNRKPTEAETLMCLPFLGRMIEIIDPKFLLFAGSTATARLLNTTQGIMRLHGQWQIYTSPRGKSYSALPTLHPAYLLRQPEHKRLAWNDLMKLKTTVSSERAQIVFR